jgi:O-antigen/teichoic acid export membrane protein
VLPCFVFLFGYAYDFITVLFTTEYTRSVSVFRIYVFLIPLNMFILSPVPPAYGRTRINFQVVAVTTAIHAALSFTLLYWIGFYGPALSAIVTSYMLSSFYFLYARKLTGGTVASLLPLSTFARVLAVGAAAVVLCKVVLGEHSHSLVGLAGAGAMFSVTFLVGCVLAGVFTDSDRMLARRWLGRLGGALGRTAS